jgi:hypothetical protein
MHMRKKTMYEQFRHFMRIAGLDEPHFEYQRKAKKNGNWEVVSVARRKLNFHSFRAYWVVDCRKRGIPIEIIADQAGHVDINTTKGYARFSDEERDRILDRAYSRLNPEADADVQPVFAVDSMPARSIENPRNLMPIEFLQMQLLRGEITEKEYMERFKLLRLS